MNISVLGCGRWGSFIAWYLNHIGHRVVLWGRNCSQELKNLQATHKNALLALSDDILITGDLHSALEFTKIIIISISAQALRPFLENVCQKSILAQKAIVLCMKGLEEATGNRLSQIVEQLVPGATTAIWVGPGHVQDFLNGIPNCMVIDSKNAQTKRELINIFTSSLIRFYYGDDLIGNEIGAAAKNTMGIAAGILDGMKLTCLKGALMSRGTKEISRLIGLMGGKEISAYGLAHLGDCQATLFSPYSNNRLFGEMFIKGEKCERLCEGVSTTKALVGLGKLHQIDLPICNAVNDVIQDRANPKEILSELFLRSLKKEI